MENLFKMTKNLIVLLLSLIVIGCSIASKAVEKMPLPPPNILWLTCEDISPNLGCYGDEYAITPNLDKLAKEGVLYTNAFASAPVCAVARSGIISGMYASSQGTQHMRCKGIVPKNIQLYPEILRASGYYCTNNSKTDYNFDMDPKSIWDGCNREAHWRDRTDKSQPFFAIFNYTSSHESRVNKDAVYANNIKNLPTELLKKPDEVPLPPYYPDTEKVRELWARYYDNITVMDRQVGEVLAQLKADGLEENTIIIYYSDHGAGIPRHKRWMYDTGLNVPLIVKVPEKYKDWLPNKAGTTTNELVSFIDMPATALHLAGLPVPKNMEGRAFIGKGLSSQRKYVYAGRDRMDERYDMQRSVRDKRYLYIRHYEPYKSFCQYMNTPEQGEIMKAIRVAQTQGTLSASGKKMVAVTKPSEELFDCQKDPWNLNNLAEQPDFQTKLQELRKAHAQWSDDTKDTGLIPETILRKWEKDHHASIYDIMRSQSVPVGEIRKTALAEMDIPNLQTNLAHKNEAVRYWAAISLGNQIIQIKDFSVLQKALKDDIPAVRFAAARAICKANQTDAGLAVLTNGLKHDNDWVRLLAAQVLDEMGEQARPTIGDLQGVMQDENKYVVRVANHALNLLLETENVVK